MVAGNTGEMEYRMWVITNTHPACGEEKLGCQSDAHRQKGGATEENTMPRNYIDTTETQGTADDKQQRFLTAFRASGT